MITANDKLSAKQVMIAECTTQAKRLHLDVDEFMNELFSRVWDSTDIPLEWIAEKVRKEAEAYRKRQQRHAQRQRQFPNDCAANRKDIGPVEMSIFNETIEGLMGISKTELESEALNVLLQRHPSFGNITEFVKGNGRVSEGHAYRVIIQLRNRIAEFFTQN